MDTNTCTCSRCGNLHLEEKKSASKSDLYKASNSGGVIQQAAEFIKPIEGFSLTPFWDIKQWTWGYGTAAGFDRNKKPGGSITKDQAHKDLVAYLTNSLNKITGAIKKPVTNGLMMALLSFDFNLGYGNTTKIIERINQGQSSTQIAAALKLYIYADGQKNDGLVNRRSKESSLFS